MNEMDTLREALRAFKPLQDEVWDVHGDYIELMQQEEPPSSEAVRSANSKCKAALDNAYSFAETTLVSAARAACEAEATLTAELESARRVLGALGFEGERLKLAEWAVGKGLRLNTTMWLTTRPAPAALEDV